MIKKTQVLKMTTEEIIMHFIENNERSYCDDCLSEILLIESRQQVNQICNRLKDNGKIVREKKQCFNCSKDKIVNILK